MVFDVKLLEQFPMKPGVYLMKDASGTRSFMSAKPICSKTGSNSILLSTGDGRAMVPFLIQQIAHIDTIVVPSEKEALLLENTLIKKHQPKFNAILKDDKTFISLMINQPPSLADDPPHPL